MNLAVRRHLFVGLIIILATMFALGACGQTTIQQQASSSASQQVQSVSAVSSEQDVAASSKVDNAEASAATSTSEAGAASSSSNTTPAEADASAAEQADYHNPGDGYMLQQVLVLSRHNIRAPLSTNGSALAQATTHDWIEWTANPSELTLRGGALETTMGQYFREWLEMEELIPQNWDPGENEARFYANAKQRTIATAQYFSSGMLPVANVPIETHAEYDAMDPVFLPGFSFLSDSYEAAASEQIAAMGGADGMAGVAAGLQDNFELLANVTDYESSPGVASGELAPFDTSDTQVTLELGEEPSMTGSLKTACSLADALVLQYYEAEDSSRAAFGRELSLEEWTAISEIKDVYGDVLFTAPLVASNVAHPLLAEIASELDAHEQGRVFTFLCGHDSNLASVLSALGAEEYELPDTIEKKTPIGAKLVLERWADEGGAQYCRLRLLYQSTEQLRNLALLTDGVAPVSFDLSLEGISKNTDGLYAYEDVRSRLQEAVDSYDDLVEEYGDSALAEAA